MNPQRKSVDLQWAGNGIGIGGPDSTRRSIGELATLPELMDRERVMMYSRSEEILDVPTWYSHTPGTAGINVYMHFRNFAIQFNNKGIDRLVAEGKL